MKKNYFLLLTLLLTAMGFSQIVSIPDANFKAKLLAANTNNSIAKNSSNVSMKIDTNNDLQIQESEALLVYKLDIRNSDIVNLEGIAAFINLTDLNCQLNEIDNLNLGMMANLAKLTCNNNQMSTLNLVGATNLTGLSFAFNDITSIDLTGLTNLTILTASENNLTNLNVTQLTNLSILNIDGNSLTSLDVSTLTNLTSLNCFDNSLTNLNTSGLVNLLEVNCQDNQITSLNVSGNSNLETLLCYNNQLGNLDVAGLTHLETLTCYENELTNLNVDGLVNLIDLNCHHNNLTSMTLSNMTNLSIFTCYNNQLSSLTFNNCPNLQGLYCGNNVLSNLDVSGLAALVALGCSSNQLTNLNLSNNDLLDSINCSYNQLSNLNVEGFDGVGLNCSHNQLSSLNFQSINEGSFDCSYNLLTTLDLSGVGYLNRLKCNNNLLTSLDVFPIFIYEIFDCSYNALTSLSLNPNNYLYEFYCNNNLLTSLEFLQPNYQIEYYNCSYNLLTTLSIGPFNELNCSHNQLTSLNFVSNFSGSVLDASYNSLETFTVPGDVQELNCQNNNLTAINFTKLYDVEYIYPLNFNENPNLQYVCANPNGIVYLQSVLNDYGYTDTEINSYCTFTPGGTFYTIQGNHKFDFNNNGCDANDQLVSNLKFTITDGTTTGNIVSDETGNYNIRVQAGSHTITPVLESPNYYTITPTSLPVVFPAQSSPVNQNFCITPNGVHPDLEVTLIPTNSASPGFDVTYKIIYKNKGTNTQSGSFSFVFDGDILDFVTSNPSTASQLPNTLTWNFSNLAPFESGQVEFTLNLNAPTETPPVNGDDILHFSATIASAATDDSPADNTATLNQTVFNSFDPNDKTCLEGSNITPEMIGNYVHYKIRFENTGTANAQRIIVSDKIDLSKFDIATLVPIDGSHAFTTRIYDGNKVEFLFENIQLPFDDANNDGYVVFKIKTLPTLTLGDSFSNSAAIYFDYNYPIFTNEAVTTIQILGTPDFEFGNYFTLYPNPASDVLNIASKKEITLTSIAIYNTLGQLVIVVPNAQNVSTIDVSNLTFGNYFLKVASDKGSSSARFIKN